MNSSDSSFAQDDARRLALACQELGPQDGPRLLMLHGITASQRYWLPRAAPLARRHRLVMPDLAGFGRSPKPFVEYSMEFHLGTLEGLIERRGLDLAPFAIVGHSLGALMALELAARLPGRVSRLALLNLPRFEDPESAHRVMMRGSASYRRLLTVNSLWATLAQLRRLGLPLTARSFRRIPLAVVADARKFTFRSLSSTLEHCLIHYSVDDVLSRCPEIPTLLVHGDADLAAPIVTVRGLTARRPFPRLRVIPGAGHHPLHTHTDHCLELLEGFLNGG